MTPPSSYPCPRGESFNPTQVSFTCGICASSFLISATTCFFCASVTLALNRNANMWIYIAALSFPLEIVLPLLLPSHFARNPLSNSKSGCQSYLQPHMLVPLLLTKNHSLVVPSTPSDGHPCKLPTFICALC